MQERNYFFDKNGAGKVLSSDEIGQYILNSKYAKRLKKHRSPLITVIIVFICGLISPLAIFEKDFILKMLWIIMDVAFFVVCFVLIVIPAHVDYKKLLRNATLYVPLVPLQMNSVKTRYIVRGCWFARTEVAFEISFKASDGNLYRLRTKGFYTRNEENAIMNAFLEKRLNVLYFQGGGRDSVILPDY